MIWGGIPSPSEFPWRPQTKEILLSLREVQGHHLLPFFSWDSFVSLWSSWSGISLGIKDTPGTKNIQQEAKPCSHDSLGLHFALLMRPGKNSLAKSTHPSILDLSGIFFPMALDLLPCQTHHSCCHTTKHHKCIFYWFKGNKMNTFHFSAGWQ